TGFETAGVLTVHVTLTNAGEAAALDQAIAHVPGVRANGFISLLPLQNSGWSARLGTNGELGSVELRYVTPGYFRAMGIPLKRGRLLADSDTALSEKVYLINEALVAKYFPDSDPVGRPIAGRAGI